MYFETMMHGSRPVASAAAAAALIKEKVPENDPEAYLHDYDALIWTAPNGRRLAVVADNHCNNPWLEVAVIDLDRNAQLESITAGWCETPEKLQRYFEDCETQDYVFRRDIKLPLDNANDDAPADFECGCCGTSFESTYAEQKKYDQDNGFGICPRCRPMYGG